jgi:hypothetical protein
VRIRLFGIEEANGLLPLIRPEIETLVRSKKELDRMQRRIEAVSMALSGATAGNSDVRVRRELVQRRVKLAESMKAGLERVQRHECLVKDFDKGLVDFYALAGDRLIFLCWQLGEPEILHWHTLEGGFSARQPLDRTEREQGDA